MANIYPAQISNVSQLFDYTNTPVANGPYADLVDVAATNLLPNPSFENNVTDGGWTAGAGYAIAYSTAVAFSGVASLEITRPPVGSGIASISNIVSAVVTTSTAHGLAAGDGLVVINGVVGATGANGSWVYTYISTTSFSISNTTAPGVYTSGGVVIPPGNAGDVLLTSGAITVSPSTTYTLSWHHIPRYSFMQDYFVVDVIPNVSAMSSYAVAYPAASGLPNDWLHDSLTFTTTTDTSVTIRIRLQFYCSVDFYLDALQLETGTDSTSYLDGSLGSGYTWSGAIHNSSSSRTAAHRFMGQIGAVPSTMISPSWRNLRGDLHQGRTFIGNRTRYDLYGIANITGTYDPLVLGGSQAAVNGVTGLYGYLTYRPLSNVSTALEGIDITVASDPSSSVSFRLLQAIAGAADHFGSGTAAAARAVGGQIQLASTSGVVTDAAAIYAYEPTWTFFSAPGPDAITNAYGLYLAPQNFGSQNVYQVYSHWPTLVNAAAAANNMAVLYAPTESVSVGTTTAATTNYYGVFIGQPTLTSAASTMRTISGNVAGVYIAGPPVAGANVVFTGTAYALYVASGQSQLPELSLVRSPSSASGLLRLDHNGLNVTGSAIQITGNVAVSGTNYPVDVLINPAYTTTMSGGFAIGISVAPTINAAVTIPELIGINVASPTVSGTLAAYFGVFIGGSPAATANYGLYVASGISAFAGPVILSPTVVAYAATISIVTSQAGTVMEEVAITGASTITATTGGAAGQLLVIRFNSTGGPFTMTFTTNFRTNGTLATTSGLATTMLFISNGTAWVEAFRGLAA